MGKQKIFQGADRAFTLVEMIVVIVIASTIASLAIVSYRKIFERQLSRDARLNLISIYSASRAYSAKHGGPLSTGYTPVPLSTVAQSLGINIVDNNFEYYFLSFSSAGSWITNARAYRPIQAKYKYGLLLNCNLPVSSTNPSCFGTCP